MISLLEVRRYFNWLVDWQNAASTATFPMNASVTVPAGMISLELEAGCPIAGPFGALVRFDYGMPASIVERLRYTGPLLLLTDTWTWEMTAMQAMIGVYGQAAVSDRFRIGGSVAGGWLRLAVAELQEHAETFPAPGTREWTIDYSGSAPAFEFRCFATYAVVSHVDVILEAGYEYAKVDSERATREWSPAGYYGTRVGDPYPRDWLSGEVIPWDLSGLGGKIALRYSF